LLKQASRRHRKLFRRRRHGLDVALCNIPIPLPRGTVHCTTAHSLPFAFREADIVHSPRDKLKDVALRVNVVKLTTLAIVRNPRHGIEPVHKTEIFRTIIGEALFGFSHTIPTALHRG
jgi:hypothetical protein